MRIVCIANDSASGQAWRWCPCAVCDATRKNRYAKKLDPQHDAKRVAKLNRPLTAPLSILAGRKENA